MYPLGAGTSTYPKLLDGKRHSPNRMITFIWCALCARLWSVSSSNQAFTCDATSRTRNSKQLMRKFVNSFGYWHTHTPSLQPPLFDYVSGPSGDCEFTWESIIALPVRRILLSPRVAQRSMYARDAWTGSPSNFIVAHAWRLLPVSFRIKCFNDVS